MVAVLEVEMLKTLDVTVELPELPLASKSFVLR